MSNERLKNETAINREAALLNFDHNLVVPLQVHKDVPFLKDLTPLDYCRILTNYSESSFVFIHTTVVHCLCI